MGQPGASGRVAIKGSYRPPEAGYRRTRVRGLDDRIEVTVLVRPRTRLPSDEETYALGLTSLRQRRHMTLKEWSEKHGATEKVLDAVQDYAVRHDLQVAGRSSALPSPSRARRDDPEHEQGVRDQARPLRDGPQCVEQAR